MAPNVRINRIFAEVETVADVGHSIVTGRDIRTGVAHVAGSSRCNVPEVLVDRGEFDTNRSADTRADRSLPINKHGLWFTVNVECVEVTVASDPKQHIAIKTVIRVGRTCGKSAKGHKLTFVIHDRCNVDRSCAGSVLTCDSIQMPFVGHGEHPRPHKVDAGNISTENFRAIFERIGHVKDAGLNHLCTRVGSFHRERIGCVRRNRRCADRNSLFFGAFRTGGALRHTGRRLETEQHVR